MTTEYKIEGMTCMGCVNSVKQKLSTIKGIESVDIQLESPQATIISSSPLSLNLLDETIGKYKISKHLKVISNTAEDIPEVSVTTYKPLILIVAFLIGITLLTQFPFSDFSFSLWMHHFMAGFFLAFSFFKLLNLNGFAESFAMYDIIAEKWKGFGMLYPFIELSLGISYLISTDLFYTNIATIVVLGIGTVGVIKSNLSKKKIKCACLGDIFNLPMSKVTIFENVTMIVMAILMLF